MLVQSKSQIAKAAAHDAMLEALEKIVGEFDDVGDFIDDWDDKRVSLILATARAAIAIAKKEEAGG